MTSTIAFSIIGYKFHLFIPINYKKKFKINKCGVGFNGYNRKINITLKMNYRSCLQETIVLRNVKLEIFNVIIECKTISYFKSVLNLIKLYIF